MIGALFHDIGKPVDSTKQGHGEIGSQICRDYHTSIGYNRSGSFKIVQIARNHSSHVMENDASLEAKVVSDADLLDEIGAITILWDAMACAEEDTPSYEKAFDRVVKAYTSLKVEMHDRFHT